MPQRHRPLADVRRPFLRPGRRRRPGPLARFRVAILTAVVVPLLLGAAGVLAAQTNPPPASVPLWVTP